MSVAVGLAWSVLISTVGLVGLKVWNWYDTTMDWETVKQLPPHTPIRRQALGTLIQSWAKLVDGSFWFILSGISFMNRNTPMTAVRMVAPAWRHLILLIMVLMEISKILIERWTRYQVEQALIDQGPPIQS